jgi:hypothetical protein
MSTDGSNYKQIGDRVTVPARQGWLTADVAQGSDPDTTHAVSIQLVDPELQLLSGTTTDADNLATLFWLDGELMSYETATLTGPGAYTLGAYLRRGVFGTPDEAHTHYSGATPPAYGAAAPFLRLDEAVFRYAYDAQLVGKTLYFKFTSFNTYQLQEEGLGDVSAVTFTPTGAYNNVYASATNSMAVDSVVTGGGASATIRIYDVTGGVGTSGTMTKQDGTVLTLPAASLSGFAFSTYYLVNWDPASGSYKTFTDARAQRQGESFGQVFIGDLTTVNSSGSGGTGGGGGGGLPGVVTVSLTPFSATTTTGGSVSFTATVSGSANSNCVWTLDPGSSAGCSVSGSGTSGTFSAGPGAHGGGAIRATSVANPACFADAGVSW